MNRREIKYKMITLTINNLEIMPKRQPHRQQHQILIPNSRK
jgi:hypothetical protein